THCLHPSTPSMTTYQFFTTAWTWNSIVLILSAIASVGYFLAFRQRGRPLYFAAALFVLLLAFISPFSALANGYLFSAHMVLHCLQRARHYPDLCASFDLSCLPTPGRSIGNPRHDSQRLGPNK